MRREEFVEWIVTLENSSSDQALEYLVHILPGNAEDWLVAGHSRGIIAASGSANLLLYISRQCLGCHSCLLAIENASNSDQTMQYISVRVEVLLGADLQKRSQ